MGSVLVLKEQEAEFDSQNPRDNLALATLVLGKRRKVDLGLSSHPPTPCGQFQTQKSGLCLKNTIRGYPLPPHLV